MTLASTHIPNDLDEIRMLLLAIKAVADDTNRRVFAMERAFIAAQNEAVAWNRAQLAIAKVMGVEIPEEETASNPAPVANAQPQTSPSALADGSPLVGGKDLTTGASTAVTTEPPNPFHALLGDPPAQSVSGETVSKPQEIDPNELDWFVGANDNYYVHGKDGEPDRRATAAEIRAINSGGKSDRPRKPRRMR